MASAPLEDDVADGSGDADFEDVAAADDQAVEVSVEGAAEVFEDLVAIADGGGEGEGEEDGPVSTAGPWRRGRCPAARRRRR